MIEKSKDLDALLENARNEWQVPGIAVAVMHKDQLLFCKGSGYRDLSKQIPVTPDTRFAVGSTTKAFTSLLLGMLVDEGKLNWDTPVKEYISWFSLFDKTASENITARDLVTHNSGLSAHDNLWYYTNYNREELVKRLKYIEPSYPFRSVYQYNNLMYMAAGYLIEHITGTSWEDAIQTRILRPMEMNNSSPGFVNDSRFPEHSKPYALRDNSVIEIPYYTNQTVGPAGSLCSTALDMSKWLRLHINNGIFQNQQLVSRECFQQLHTPNVVIRKIGQPSGMDKLEHFDEIGFGSYALGWRINTYRNHTMIHHSGAIDGFTSLVSYMPNEDVGIIVLANMSGSPLPHLLTFSIYDRLLGLEPINWNQRVKEYINNQKSSNSEGEPDWCSTRHVDTTPSHNSLEDFTGIYEHPAYGRFTVELQDGNLLAHYGTHAFPLSHVHYDVFEFSNDFSGTTLPVAFYGDVSGNISHLSIPFEQTVDSIVFAKHMESIQTVENK